LLRVRVNPVNLDNSSKEVSPAPTLTTPTPNSNSKPEGITVSKGVTRLEDTSRAVMEVVISREDTEVDIKLEFTASHREDTRVVSFPELNSSSLNNSSTSNRLLLPIPPPPCPGVRATSPPLPLRLRPKPSA
jgi:hypothetical protein